MLLLLQVVQLFDSWAHHLSPKQFSEFSWPYAEQLIERVKSARPHVPLIFHANGGTGKLHIIAKRSHQDVVVGLDWATDMQEARSQFGADTVLQVGNNYSHAGLTRLLFLMSSGFAQIIHHCCNSPPVKKPQRHSFLSLPSIVDHVNL